MNELSNRQKAVELLQQLGFKEYEAKCFVALSQLPKGTAKDVAETCDVPRTRVYDAIRILEKQGLVEVQHTNPQQFRAVPLGEAVELLRQKYESRTEELETTLENLEPKMQKGAEEVAYEVWSIAGATSIANRTCELIKCANTEIALVVGSDAVFTNELAECLRRAQEKGVDIVIRTTTDQLSHRVREALGDVDIFTSDLEWLHGSPFDPDDNVTISRLLIIDQSTILVSSLHQSTNADGEVEKAVFGKGFDNGIVVIARRIMATGLSRGPTPSNEG